MIQIEEKKLNHIPVMLKEVISFIDIKDGIYCDATVGGGGHTEALLKKSSNKIKIIAIDQDETALSIAQNKLKNFKDQIIFHHGNFGDIKEILKKYNIQSIDGLIVDLGVSSFQLDEPLRGFSFLKSGPLDMRMDQKSNNETLAKFLDRLNDKELGSIIINFGEEKKGRKIAKLIKEYRKKGLVNNTEELADVVRKAIGKVKINFRDVSTKTFQALRIGVNRELEMLEKLVFELPDILSPDANAIFISFNSLEDRIVKQGMKNWSTCRCPMEIMYCECGGQKLKILTKKPMLPSSDEIKINPRSRSAKLRVCKKIAIEQKGKN